MLRSGLFNALDIRRKKISLQSEIVYIVILFVLHRGKIKKKLNWIKFCFRYIFFINSHCSPQKPNKKKYYKLKKLTK